MRGDGRNVPGKAEEEWWLTLMREALGVRAMVFENRSGGGPFTLMPEMIAR